MSSVLSKRVLSKVKDLIFLKSPYNKLLDFNLGYSEKSFGKFSSSSLKERPMEFAPVEAQLEILMRGIEKVVPEVELKEKLIKSQATKTPLRVKYGIDPTAASVHHAASLPVECIALDVSNACLGLLNGMLMIADLIELGRIKAGVVVGTETGRDLVEGTIDDMLAFDDPWVQSYFQGKRARSVVR